VGSADLILEFSGVGLPFRLGFCDGLLDGVVVEGEAVDEAVERVSSEFVLAGRGGKSSLVLFSY
jgi:hypothetical protein